MTLSNGVRWLLVIVQVNFLSWVLLASQNVAQPPAPQTKEQAQCWPGGEVKNPGVSARKPPPLPERLSGAVIQRSLVSLKLCIDSVGKVDRTMILNSSGNKDVDAFYVSELSKWAFKPAYRERVPVPSVVVVAITLYVRD